MDAHEFQKVIEDFKKSDTGRKIDIYISTEGLTQSQYKELLRLYPMEELYRLEEALA